MGDWPRVGSSDPGIAKTSRASIPPYSSGSASRLREAVETIPGGRIYDDESVRPVVLDRAGDVAPINRTQPIGVLLQLKSCGGRRPGNNHRVRRSAPYGEMNWLRDDRRILD